MAEGSNDIRMVGFRTAIPCVCRYTEERMGLDIDIHINVEGRFSFYITDREKAMGRFLGSSVDCSYTEDALRTYVRRCMLEIVGAAVIGVSSAGVEYFEFIGSDSPLSKRMLELTKIGDRFDGIEVTEVDITKVIPCDEDIEQIHNMEEMFRLTDPDVAAARRISELKKKFDSFG